MYNFDPFPKLSSDRLVLKSLSRQDLSPIFALRSSSAVAKYLDRALMRHQRDAESYLDTMLQGVSEGKWIIWGIHFEQEGFVGSICLWNISEEKSTADIGYELLPSFQGKGIMSETIPLVLQYGFQEMDLHRIEAEVHPQNIPSIVLLEKYGFTATEKRPHPLENPMPIYTLSR